MSRHPRADDSTEHGFLNRWSRRKRGLDATREASEAPPENPAAAADSTAEAGEAGETPPKTDADMPDLETIDETTAMHEFFSPGVSETLRNRALKRLFHMAKFNVTDGLDDYCEDFRSFQPLGDLVTADMRHRTEMAKQRLAQAEEPEPASETPQAAEEDASEPEGEWPTRPEEDEQIAESDDEGDEQDAATTS